MIITIIIYFINNLLLDIFFTSLFNLLDTTYYNNWNNRFFSTMKKITTITKKYMIKKEILHDIKNEHEQNERITISIINILMNIHIIMTITLTV